MTARQPSDSSVVRFDQWFWSLVSLLSLSIACLLVLLFTGGRIHRLGMNWAASEQSAYMSGTPRGIVGSYLTWPAIDDWARYHRDALVNSGRLVHRNYRFDQIPCFSPASAWLHQQFLVTQIGRAETTFSTTGKSSSDDFYEVNVWCEPKHVAFWDAWFAKYNDLESIAAILAIDKAAAGSITTP